MHDDARISDIPCFCKRSVVVQKHVHTLKLQRVRSNNWTGPGPVTYTLPLADCVICTQLLLIMPILRVMRRVFLCHHAVARPLADINGLRTS